MKTNGYIVMESCEDYEQGLTLRTGGTIPPAGILDWCDKGEARVIFADRKSARDAITRTEHYRLAWGRTDLPERQHCKVEPVHFLANVRHEP